MTASRLRVGLDVLAAVTMTVAAVVLLWRLLSGGPHISSQPRPTVEDVEGAGISTTTLGAPSRGTSNASLVVVEFGDFECPYCARFAHESFDQFEQEFVSTGDVEYVFRHLPLPNHPFALSAAQAAECAAKQGKFWEMRSHLFKNQLEFTNSVWLRPDSGSSVDLVALKACLAESDQARIRADIAEAARLGIQSTPTFLIGRRRSDGSVDVVARINGAVPYSAFKALLAQFDR